MNTTHARSTSILAALLAFPLCSQAVDDGFDRYAVILSRMPFGEAPIEEAPPPKPAPVTTESFARAFRVCSITKPMGGGPIKVGIVNKAEKNAVFMLYEGEENQEGIKLVSANLDEEEAVLQKGGEIALLKLGEEPVTKLSSQDLAKRKTPTAANYAERRKQRREEILKREKPTNQVLVRPPPKYTGEELRTHLREYNMEAIRQGLPALPIELTPEQDFQLVQEGLLPAAEGVAQPSPQAMAPIMEQTLKESGVGSLIEGLPPELADIKINDLSPEDLKLLLQQ